MLPWNDSVDQRLIDTLSLSLLFKLIVNFPKSIRSWADNDKSQKNLLSTFLSEGLSNAIFEKEVEKIEMAENEWRTYEFEILVSRKAREISAVYLKDDQSLEISLKVPTNYPLQLLEVDFSRAAKFSEAKAKQWSMLIKRMLTTLNYGIKDALIGWKNNMEKELQGIDECAICFCVIHPTSKKLPEKKCKTCKKKLHTECVHKWFQQSQKNDCPLCKSPFL